MFRRSCVEMGLRSDGRPEICSGTIDLAAEKCKKRFTVIRGGSRESRKEEGLDADYSVLVCVWNCSLNQRNMPL